MNAAPAKAMTDIAFMGCALAGWSTMSFLSHLDCLKSIVMEETLPERLDCVVQLVPEGARVADVGTDHAQIPVALVRSGRTPHVLAIDVAQGPLRRARQTCEDYSGQIEVRQSDGLLSVRPGEVDCVVLAGMGGLTIARILTEGRAVCKELQRVIVQPQGSQPEVRAVLLGMGWACLDGRLVEDRGKIYTVEAWAPSAEPQLWSVDDLRWGRLPRARGDALYRQWIQGELANSLQALERMIAAGQGEHPDATRRRAEAQALRGELARCQP